MNTCDQKSIVRVFFVFILFFVFSNGCGGYHFASDYNNLPGEITSISIPFFQNETYEANIESYFTRALINEFIKNKKFTILSHGADATLYGIVKNFRTSTIAYSAQDKVLEYRAYITLDLTLKNNNTSETIWRKPSLTSDEDYKVSSEDIALTEATKKVAFQKIANELAEQIYEELVLGF
jgi:hypothetical protein